MVRCRHGEEVALRQEQDVLDTWFSSGLWCALPQRSIKLIQFMLMFKLAPAEYIILWKSLLVTQSLGALLCSLVHLTMKALIRFLFDLQ